MIQVALQRRLHNAVRCLTLAAFSVIAMVCGLPGAFLTLAMAQENPGKQLYESGQGASALLMQGRIKVPANRFPCANCHGDDGMGSREGATVIPPINWNALSSRTANRPAFTIQSFQAAVFHGQGADNNELSEVMPRYEIDQETVLHLVDYLQTLDIEQRAGLSADAIQIVLPQNADSRSGFIAAINQFNNDGGSYGRLVKLTDDEEGFLIADTVDRYVKNQLDNILFKKLIETLQEDGHKTVAHFSGEPNPLQNYELEQAGLQFDPEANAVVLLDRQMSSEADIDAWLHRSTADGSAVADTSGSVRALYAAASAIAPYLAKFLESDTELVLIDYDEQSARWALSQQQSASAAAGFATGRLLGEALLQSGRNPTRTAVMRSLESIDLQERLFTWRTTQE